MSPGKVASIATAIAILPFAAGLREFMMPRFCLADQRLYPLSLGLYAFAAQITNPGTAKGMVMAGSFFMTLPVIAMFFLAQAFLPARGNFDWDKRVSGSFQPKMTKNKS